MAKGGGEQQKIWLGSIDFYRFEKIGYHIFENRKKLKTMENRMEDTIHFVKQYVVDVFIDQAFSGNPAAVCLLDEWLPDIQMERIAMENNLSETAFAVKGQQNHYGLRWFSPNGEVDLCGHATLATGYVLINSLYTKQSAIAFNTLSGTLTVTKQDELYQVDLPAYSLRSVEITDDMVDAIGALPEEVYQGRDLLCVFDDEAIVRRLRPNLDKLKKLDGLLLHATAPGEYIDCVSRTFAPKLDVAEDAVCGSGHCHIAPYWIKRLNKNKIVAYQASKRGGTLYCSMKGDRVQLAGRVALFSIAEISSLSRL